MSKKRMYSNPMIEVTIIELEQGIAAQSANIHGGSGAPADTPLVEDWADSGMDTKIFDI